MNTNCPTIWSRFELKYLVNESVANALEQYMAPFVTEDVYSRSNGMYSICSLYLDSEHLALCHESLDGKASRFKLRIRCYDDEEQSPLYFEVKRRVNSIIVKSRAAVDRADFPDLVRGLSLGHRYPADTREAMDQFQLYRQAINARGIIKIRYLRRAYEGLDDKNNVRITFDRHICSNTTNHWDVKMGGIGWSPLPQRKIVLEIKFTGTVPQWVARMVNVFGLAQQSFSKYTTAVQNAVMLKYCAPAGWLP